MDLIIYMDDIEQKCIYEIMEYATRVRTEMTKLAKSKFATSTASKYIKGLSDPVLEAEYQVMFALEGWLPVSLEDGVDSFDMKPGLMRSPKVKISKSGKKYMNIPVFKAAFSNPYLKAVKASAFRTVTENSHPNSWIHPGLDARNLFGLAVRKVS